MFRRLTFLCLAAICAAAPIGCSTPGGKICLELPSTVYAPSVVQQTTGPTAVSGLGAHANEPLLTQPARLAYMPPADAPARGPTLASRASCTLDDLCSGLERIERLLARQAQALPMPKKVEEQED